MERATYRIQCEFLSMQEACVEETRAKLTNIINNTEVLFFCLSLQFHDRYNNGRTHLRVMGTAHTSTCTLRVQSASTHRAE